MRGARGCCCMQAGRRLMLGTYFFLLYCLASCGSVIAGHREWPPFSMAQCIGDLAIEGFDAAHTLVRNTGGGTSACCSIHPRAAPARAMDATLELPLQARLGSSQPSRNGARVYLAESCTEGSYAETRYAATKLLGKTLSVTVDLSAAECGCNAAWYVVSMAQNTVPGRCDGDYYCDANAV